MVFLTTNARRWINVLWSVQNYLLKNSVPNSVPHNRTFQQLCIVLILFLRKSFQKSLFCSVLSINATIEKQPVPPLTKPTHLTTDCPFKDSSIQLDLLHSIECSFQRTGDYLSKIYMALCKKHHLRILRNCARPSHSKPPQSRCWAMCSLTIHDN